MPSITLPPKSLNFSKDVIHCEIEGTLFTGAGPYEPSEDNLSCYVQVWMDDADGNTTFLAEINPPYSLYNKKCFFDISSLLRVFPEAPSRLTTYPTTRYTGSFKNASCKFYFKYADQYGTPAVPEETLINSGDYYAIYGGSKYLQGFDANEDTVLHSYKDWKGQFFMKEVIKQQTDLLCCWSTTNKNIALDVTFYYTDGTTSTLNAYFSAAVKAHKVNYLTCGYNQLDLDSLIDGNKTLAYYKIATVGLLNEGEIYYHLDDRCPDFNEFVLYDNGCGGLEVVRFGNKEVSTEADFITYARPRDANTSFQTGTIGKKVSGGRDIYTMRSPFYSRAYCWHLRQLLLGDQWYIDTARLNYYKMIILGNRVKCYDEAEDLHYIEIAFMMDEMTTATTFNF